MAHHLPPTIPCRVCGVKTYRGICRVCVVKVRKKPATQKPRPPRSRWGPRYWTVERCEAKGHAFRFHAGEAFARCMYCGTPL